MNPSLIMAVLLFGFVLCGGCVNAQIGQKLENAKAQNNIIDIREKKECGEDFVLVSTEERKGIFVEAWFYEGICVYARWMDRAGEPTQDNKELLWKANFGKEKVAKKTENKWEGERGNSISWSKMKNGMDVMVAESKKMSDILAQEVRRQMGYGKKDDGVTISFQNQQVYGTDGMWRGTIRNGSVYGTDGMWRGTIRNGSVYGTDGTWEGRINGNGQIYNTDSQWKGSVR